MNNIFPDPKAISVSNLMSRDLGESIEFTIKVPTYDDPEIQILPDQTITFTAYRIEDGIVVMNQDEELRVKATCVVTLKEFELDYPLREMERQYYWDIPEEVDPLDVGQIDKKYHQIDLSDFLKEIVFLSLPTIIKSPEASNKFKEIPVEEEEATQTPFANLKDMLGE